MSRSRALLFVCSLFAVPLHAATFTVNTMADTADALPGNGSCADSLGACSLRAAVMEANASGGSDTISVPAGTYNLAIGGANEDAALTGDLDVTSNTTIAGDGSAWTIVDGGALDRVFDVAAGATVSISGLTVRDGRVDGTSADGGAIRNAGTLTITSSVISGSFAYARPTASGDARGGGIFSSGSLTVSLSRVTGNTADAGGGTSQNVASGGGIAFSGTATIERTTIDLNTANAFGRTPTVMGTFAHARGGGLAQLSGTLDLRTSTINANVADATPTTSHGGWVTGGGLSLDGAASLVNCTISDNVATPGNLTAYAAHGGGIFHAGGTQLYEHLTVAGNTANFAGGIAPSSSAVTVRNSIVADNTGGASGSVLITSGGYNIFGPNDSAYLAAQPSDRLNVSSPGLAPLADNGGPTKTRAIVVGSIAVDHAQANCVATDQRGSPRPADGNGDGAAVCDSGAFELCGTPAITGPSSALPGATVTLQATPGGTSYQWYRQGVAIPGANTATLTLTNVSAATHGGSYYVEASFAFCAVSRSLDFPFTVRQHFNDDLILWRRGGSVLADGQDYVWRMSGATIVDQRALPVAPLEWVPWGTGDLDADGDIDWVWQNTQTFQPSVWLTQSDLSVVPLGLPIPSGGWRIQLVSDFDGDARADILWSRALGDGISTEMYLWFMNGSTIRAARPLPTVAETYEPRYSGDFDGDGDADVMLRNNQGGLRIWYLQGGAFARQAQLPTFNQGYWLPEAVGDFDGDGDADLLWHEDMTGQNYIWFLQNDAVTPVPLINTAAPWFPTAIGDFDHDGRDDIVWRRLDTGENYIWFMNGATPTAAPLLTVPDSWWRIVGPDPRSR